MGLVSKLRERLEREPTAARKTWEIKPHSTHPTHPSVTAVAVLRGQAATTLVSLHAQDSQSVRRVEKKKTHTHTHAH